MPIDLLGDMFEAAAEMLGEGFSKDEPKTDWVKLTVDESLGNTFMFLIINKNNNFTWQRKIWRKKDDVFKATNPIESLKYITSKIIPDVLRQEGVTDSEDAQEIFNISNRIININTMEKSDKIVLDGEKFTLQISLNNLKKEFKWDAVPLHWNEVELLAEKMVTLNNNLY